MRIVIAVAIVFLCVHDASARTPALSRLKAHDGWRVSVAVDRVAGVTDVAVVDDGIVAVFGDTGDIVLYSRKKGDGRRQTVTPLYKTLPDIVAVASSGSTIFIATSSDVYRADNVSAGSSPVLVSVAPGLTGITALAAGDDGSVFVATRASCEYCITGAGSISRITPGGVRHTYAAGVREISAMAFRDGVLWFVDRSPRWGTGGTRQDELNRADGAGRHFGYPFIIGGKATGRAFPQPGQSFVYPERMLASGRDTLGAECSSRGTLILSATAAWDASNPDAALMEIGAEGDPAVVVSGWHRADGVSWGTPGGLAGDGTRLYLADGLAGVIWKVEPLKKP